MISKKQIWSRIKSKFGSRRVSLDKRDMHPAREWVIGLFLFFLVVIVGSVYSAHVFMSYRNISSEPADYVEKVQYNYRLVDTILKLYGERKSNFLDLAASNTVIPAEVVAPVVEQGTTTAPVSTTTESSESEIDSDAIILQ